MKIYFDISVSCSYFLKLISVSFPLSQLWVNSIAFSNFISCLSTRKTLSFFLSSHPHLYASAIHTHRSLPHHGCLIKDYRQPHSEPHLPEEELEQSHSLSSGACKEWIYRSPMRGLPCWHSGTESTCKCRRHKRRKF